MMRPLLIALVLLSVCQCCSAYRVLIVPMFGRSHFMALNVVAEELSKRGHEVLHAVPDYEADFGKGNPFAKLYKLNVPKEYINVNVAGMGVLGSLQFLASAQIFTCQSFLESGIMDNSFDLVIGETLYPCGAAVAAKLGVPYVAFGLGSLSLGLVLPVGMPVPAAYVPASMSALPSKMTFTQRLQNAAMAVGTSLIRRYWLGKYDEMNTKYQLTQKTFHQLIAETDLVLFQGDFALEVAQPLPPVVKMIGPLQPKPASPLPSQFQKIMEDSGENGVVYMAFGTVTQATIPKESEHAIARALGRLPMKVIWKKKGGEDLPIGKNTHLMSWLPQNDILGHDKTRVFITHSGHNGIYEAAYHSVPMVACPLFGDQHDNAAHVVEKGMGITVNVHQPEGLEQRLYDAVMAVATEERYTAAAQRASRVLKNRLRSPKEEAVDWIEHVLAVGDTNHLKPLGNQMPFYQHYLLDVWAFVLLILTIVIYTLSRIFKACCRLCSTRKEKTH